MKDDKDWLHDLDDLGNPDNLIDRALDSYTARDPGPGLTERVLSSRASMSVVDPLRRRTDRPIWALAVAVALLAVAVILLWFKSPRVALVSPSVDTAQDSLRTAMTSMALPQPAWSARASVIRHVVSGPKAWARVVSDSDTSAVFAPIVMKPIAIVPIRIGEPD